MEGVRREAIQRALMRLVTRESDTAWRSSSSSLADAGIEANRCIKVFIARNPDEVGSDNSIAVEPFDLNHSFGGDGKIYGYKSLKISVWISAISFHAYADISFLETSNGGKGIMDLKLSLLNIFGENLVEKDEFLHTFSKECEYISDAVMNGHVIKHAASADENSAVEIVRVELQGAAAVLYSRLVPLVLLLVEGSTIIDIKEHGWEMKKATHESSRPKLQLLGFAAARHFYHYPESRLRISQLKINLKQFLRCFETLMYLNLDAEDRESMDKMRVCIYNRVKGEMRGRANGKQVASSLDEGRWLACRTEEEHRAENDMTPEEELNQLVDKNLKTIAKVAKDLVSCGQG